MKDLAKLQAELAIAKGEQEAAQKIFAKKQSRAKELEKQIKTIVAREEHVLSETALLDCMQKVIDTPTLIKLREMRFQSYMAYYGPYDARHNPHYYCAHVPTSFIKSDGTKVKRYLQFSLWTDPKIGRAHMTVGFLKYTAGLYNHRSNNILQATFKLDSSVKPKEYCISAILPRLRKTQERRAKKFLEDEEA